METVIPTSKLFNLELVQAVPNEGPIGTKIDQSLMIIFFRLAHFA
jgi:hypothetical protein